MDKLSGYLHSVLADKLDNMLILKLGMERVMHLYSPASGGSTAKQCQPKVVMAISAVLNGLQ